MARSGTVLNHMVHILPGHEFEFLAKVHYTGQRFRTFNRWSPFLSLPAGQLSARRSLRDLVDNIAAQNHKRRHPGMRPTSRTPLARVNEQPPTSLYETVFRRILNRCQRYAPKHRFKLKKTAFHVPLSKTAAAFSIKNDSRAGPFSRGSNRT